jgi:hypothetical protein
MIVVYTRHSLPANRRAALEGAYRRAAAPLTASIHCLAYELAPCSEVADGSFLRIEWDLLE